MKEVIAKIYDVFETDEEKAIWRNWLRKQISTGIVEVTFEKKDGSIRVLKGTTHLGNIPINHHPIEGKERKINKDEVCTIFDLEANGWRSFIFGTVIDVRPNLHLKEVNIPNEKDLIPN